MFTPDSVVILATRYTARIDICLDFGRLGFVPTNICSLKFLRLWNLQLHYCAYKMPTIGPYPKPAEFVHLASAFSKIGFEAVSFFEVLQ